MAQGRLLPSFKELLQIVVTFLLVVGWIIFRAENINDAFNYITLMVTDFTPHLPEHGKSALLYIAILMIVEWLHRDRQFGLQISDGGGLLARRTVRWTIYVILALFTLLCAGTQEEFIYFQF